MGKGEIEQLKAELAKLPRRSVSRKRIAGKDRFYRQWVEDGRTRSEYLAADRVDAVRAQIERRRQLERQLRALGVRRPRATAALGRAQTGKSLWNWTSPVANWDHRDIFPAILKDSSFVTYPPDEQAYVTGRILDGVRGRMLEDIYRNVNEYLMELTVTGLVCAKPTGL